MKPVALADLAHYLGGTDRVDDPRVCATGWSTDDRLVKPGDVFIAIRGESVDGHSFAGKAIGRGAVATLCEREVEGPHILVGDVVEALARMASHFRNAFDGPVVGVTGSAGKTTTKEFVAAALSPLGPVLKNEGNRNTEYTSPLVWTDMMPEHRAAVIEMGMRGFGQVAHLASFTRPTIGLITNIGYAHIEMVGDRAGIAKAKGELFEALPEDGWGVLWQEDDYLETLSALAPKGRVKTFGFGEKADSRIVGYRPLDWSACKVEGVCEGQEWQALLPAAGRHIAQNAAAAMEIAYLAGVLVADAAAALPSVTIPPMRMEVIERDGATFVLDCYNASPPSMMAAIDLLAELPVRGRRRAVIGEMRELGEATDESHRDIGRVLARQGIDEVIFYGGPMRLAYETANNSRYQLAESLEDVSRFLNQTVAGDVVLIKGSRALELEKALTAEVRS